MPTPFITAQDLSDILGRDVTNDNGATIAIDAACDMCRTISEQQFNRGTTTATLDGSGTDSLVLPQMPVTSAGTVLVAGGTITDYVLKENGVLIRKLASSATDSWTGWRPDTIVWPYGRQNVQVTYDHGYDDADLPRDVRMVALAYAQRLVVQGPAIQEGLGQASIRYAGAATDLTVGEKAILRKYRR